MRISIVVRAESLPKSAYARTRKNEVPQFVISIAFRAEPVDVVVEAESMTDAWNRRREIAAEVRPTEWLPHTVCVAEYIPLGDKK